MKFALAVIAERLKSISQPASRLLVARSGKKEKTGCDRPPPIPYGKLNCTDRRYSIGSNCSVACTQNHILEGETDIVCMNNSQWSSAFGRCNCQECETGEYCEQTTSWIQFKSRIMQKEGQMTDVQFLEYYAEHQINCSSWDAWHDRNCGCTDMETGHIVTCLGYSRREVACEHASAEMIRQMIKKNIYPTPCDLHKMTKGC
ncbi:uncharacterized protein LOC120344837 [Styela clava]